LATRSQPKPVARDQCDDTGQPQSSSIGISTGVSDGGPSGGKSGTSGEGGSGSSGSSGGISKGEDGGSSVGTSRGGVAKLRDANWIVAMGRRMGKHSRRLLRKSAQLA